MQTLLFYDEEQQLPIEDGRLRYLPHWLTYDEATELLLDLKRQVEWEQSSIHLYGKKVRVPRLNAWFGDDNCHYAYSGSHLKRLPWLPVLHELKNKLQGRVNAQFNSVLVNFYRNGSDSVAWHSDDEPELGRNPTIASVSLGAEREFQLRHRYQKSTSRHKIKLGHGSLLIMDGELQHHWQHQVPKENGLGAERINLTFRYVEPQAGL